MNKKILWSFQFSYWSVYFLYTIFVVHYTTLVKENTNPVILISYLILLCYFGIPLSILAKKIVGTDRFNSMSLIKILIAVTLISVILGNIWVLEIILLDKLYDQILQVFSITRYRIIPLKWRAYMWESFSATLLLFAWIAIYLFLKYWNQWQKQRFEIEKANLQLELAQLKMLRSQISPHFLFNALSSLRALIRNDAIKAEQMLSKISEFLRYSLVNKINVEVPFSEELLATKNYFDIEKVRFGDKLQVEYIINPLADDFPVPGFILHPIIENSVKYGMASSTLPLRINIIAQIQNNRLHIEVTNSGKWNQKQNETNGTGTGLQNIKSRLQTLYPGRHHFNYAETDGFVKITLEIERSRDEIS
jgi:two-component system, LytTR family, sensor kinase